MIRYYCLVRHWPKVSKLIEHPHVQAVMVRDLNTYSMTHNGRPFTHGMLPVDVCSSDWMYRGKYLRMNPPPFPAYFGYCCFAACHWVVNFTLELAQLCLPKRPWRIVSSQAHSTVWDGDKMLFDFNWQGVGISAPNALATAKRKGRVRSPGKHIRCYPPTPWVKEELRKVAIRPDSAG